MSSSTGTSPPPTHFTKKGAPGLLPPPGRANQSFATFLILCSTSFFLGLLFSLFPYDYPLLWTSTPPPDPFTPLEQHYLILANAPPLIERILHIIMGVGILGFMLKLYRATESNMLFDGASLVLYVIGIVIYITNVVKGLNVVKAGDYDKVVVEDDKDAYGIPGLQVEGLLTREDSLKVLSASHTILALVLTGVLVFQVGQWYADRKEGLRDLTAGEESDKRVARSKKKA